jgi:hypothetical protein
MIGAYPKMSPEEGPGVSWTVKASIDVTDPLYPGGSA